MIDFKRDELVFVRIKRKGIVYWTIGRVTGQSTRADDIVRYCISYHWSSGCSYNNVFKISQMKKIEKSRDDFRFWLDFWTYVDFSEGMSLREKEEMVEKYAKDRGIIKRKRYES